MLDAAAPRRRPTGPRAKLDHKGLRARERRLGWGLEESIELPTRSSLGPARSYMGLRPPSSVQMASKFGGVHPLQCPRAFTMA
jgi:hypothetical protein